jgi:tetratricopeptide (TPR) repeat protein
MVQSYIYLNGMTRTGAYLAEVRSAAETAMKLQPELGEAWLARGYYYYRGLGDFDAAIAAFQQASKRLPNSGEVSAAIAYVQRRQGKWDEALANLTLAAGRDPQNLSYWTGMSEIYAAMRRYPQAQAALDHVIEMNPDRAVDLKSTKATYYQDAGDLDAAQKVFDTLPADDPKLAIHFSTQWLYRRDYARIAPKLETLLTQTEVKLGDDAASIYSLVGASYYYGGQLDKARTAFGAGKRLAMESRKNGSDSYNLSCNLSINLAGLGENEAALAEARHCIELVSNDHWQYAAALKAQAQVQALTGDNEAALSSLQPLAAMPNGITLGDLRYSPVWDALRGDPRFQAALQRTMTPATPPSAP